MKIRLGVGFLCIAFLLIFINNTLAQEHPQRKTRRTRPKAPEVGTIAKDFSLETTDGKTFTLSEQKGKIVVLEFGACT